MFLLLLGLVAIFANRRLSVHKAKKIREHFFKQNRGLFLRQLVDKDIAEKMIFSLEELERAINLMKPESWVMEGMALSIKACCQISVLLPLRSQE